MEFSPAGISNLATALAAAQADIKSAAKDSENPHFRSKYADLSSVWDACREALTKNGLAVSQTIATSDRDVHVATVLLHKSGEWIKDTLTLQAKDASCHSVGSCATYGRRFSLAAIVGVAPADETADDGNAASLPPAPVERKQVAPPPAAPADDLTMRFAGMRLQLVKLFGEVRTKALVAEFTKEHGKDREAVLTKMREAIAEDERAHPMNTGGK